MGFENGEVMKFREINYVNSEGGPLLLVDANYGNFWSGIDGPDYDRACEFFDSHPLFPGGPISIGDGNGLLWEMSGAGTAYIFDREDNGLVIVRTWPADPSKTNIQELMVKEPTENLTRLGDLDVASGILVVLWAVENGECVKPEDLHSEGRPSGELAIDTSGAVIKLAPALYECWHDEIKNELGVARRCHFYRKV
jgi:hypothetical protein